MVARPITVVQMLPDLESGGVERGTLEMGQYLASRGHRSLVISAGGRMVSRLEAEGSRHLSWPVGDKHPGSLRYLLPLRRLLAGEPVDILHLRSRMPAWIGYLAWKSLPPGCRPALVTTFHGFYSVNRYSAVMARGEKVIAVSEAIAGHVRARYKVSGDRIALIYRGIDETVFSPDAVSPERVEALRRRMGLAGCQTPLVMLAARITRLKGHDLLLTSLAGLRDLPWTCVFVGDADETSAYPPMLKKQVEALGLQDRVVFAGHCDDMPAALALSDVVVSASREPESFGRTAVEAQAMGRPVVASAHGGSLEVVRHGETGWLFQPGDPQALAHGLKTVLADPMLRQRWGARGRKWVARRFTVSRMCEKTVDIYGALLSSKQGEGR
ncbi:MAG: glycosyltransferase family 4 protein [Desulfobacterales bacterium]|nr:glycosyltransferase family 4 protein [Desulfobacterales bacterium]